MMGPQRAWLAAYSWDFVTAQNAILCAAKNALHKPTSDGHDVTRERWISHHQETMGLDEAGRSMPPMSPDGTLLLL
jgi:hypothetical protein